MDGQESKHGLQTFPALVSGDLIEAPGGMESKNGYLSFLPQEPTGSRSIQKDLWLSYFPQPDLTGEASAGDRSTDAPGEEAVAAFGGGNV